MALSQPGSQLSRPHRDEAKSGRAGWYVSGVLGVLLFMNLLQGRPDTNPRATSAAGTSLRPVATSPSTPIGPPADPTRTSTAGYSSEASEAQAATSESTSEPTSAAVAQAKPDTKPKPVAAAPLARTAAADDDRGIEVSPAEAATLGAQSARDRGDLSTAAAQYTRALQANPHFFPAALGLADTQWNAGNKVAAQNEYKRILASFPSSMIPAHVRARASETVPPPP